MSTGIAVAEVGGGGGGGIDVTRGINRGLCGT